MPSIPPFLVIMRFIIPEIWIMTPFGMIILPMYRRINHFATGGRRLSRIVIPGIMDSVSGLR